jgi:SAM-dependent methyltransferase
MKVAFDSMQKFNRTLNRTSGAVSEIDSLYKEDLAYIQAVAFGELARGAAPAIVERLLSAKIPIHRLVEVGCGAGPLTSALVDAGFDVLAIDASSELLTFARKAAPGARFIHGSLHNMVFPVCDAIIAVGEPLTYQRDSDDADSLIETFFRRASEALPRGGLLIFDVIETGEPSLSGRAWRAGNDWAVLVDTHEDQPARGLERDIETFRRVGDLYRREREIHKVRMFETDRLLDQLASLGFETETSQCYGEQPLPLRRRAFFATRVR